MVLDLGGNYLGYDFELNPVIPGIELHDFYVSLQGYRGAHDNQLNNIPIGMEFPFVGKARKVRQRIKSILKIMYHQLKIIVMKCIVLMYVLSENLMEKKFTQHI